MTGIKKEIEEVDNLLNDIETVEQLLSHVSNSDDQHAALVMSILVVARGIEGLKNEVKMISAHLKALNKNVGLSNRRF